MWEISWLLSLGGEGRSWPGPQPHSRMAGHSWKKRPSILTALSAPYMKAFLSPCSHSIPVRQCRAGLLWFYRTTGKSKAREMGLTCSRHNVPRGKRETRASSVRGIFHQPPSLGWGEASDGIGGGGSILHRGRGGTGSPGQHSDDKDSHFLLLPQKAPGNF